MNKNVSTRKLFSERSECRRCGILRSAMPREISRNFVVIINYEKFKNTFNRSVNLFYEAGSISRKHGSGRSNKRTERVQHEAQEIIFCMFLNNLFLTGICHKLLRKKLQYYSYRRECFY